MATPKELQGKELQDLLRRQQDLARFEKSAQTRSTEWYKQQMEDAEQAKNYAKDLQEMKGSFRNQSGADWLTVMMAIFRTLTALGKALHASSSAKRAEDALLAFPKELIAAGKGWVKDSLSWSGNRLLEKMKLKEREKLPDITVNIKIDDKDGSFKCQAMIYGCIPLKDYFIRDMGQHSLLGAAATQGEVKDIANKFEEHFQNGFEDWLKTKGCKLNDNQKIVNSDNKPLTQTELINLNKGPGNLSEFLSDSTRLADGQQLNVTAEPNELPDASPSPL